MNSYNYTILVVDDDPQNLTIIGGALSREGYTVKAFTDAQEAIDFAKNSDKIDLILLDAIMPSMDGYQACEIIKTNSKLKNVPIIFISGLQNDKDIEKGLQIGAIDFITKPINLGILKIKVKNHLQHKALSDTLEETLLEQSRLATMGEMLGCIAHQWRQPLNALSITVQDVQDAYQYDELDEQYIEKFATNAMGLINFMSHTMEDFMNFTKNSSHISTFNAVNIVQKVLFLMTGQFKSHGIAFDIYDEGECFIRGIENNFSQILLNIVANAKDALIEHRVQDPHLTIKLIKDDHSVIVTIADNAGGIHEEILEKIFEKNFTTKAAGKGTGIGLYMTKKIIEESFGGTIFVNNSHEGAEFTLVIPRSLV